MSKLMYADMGLSVMAGLSGYAISREESKLNAAMQRYQNTMSALSAGMDLNNISRNAAVTRDNNLFADLSIQTSALEEQAAYTVEAAAAGIVGNSVNVGMRQRDADAARAQTSRKRQYDAERLSIEDQRKQVRLGMIMNKDVSPIKRPSLGAALFNISTDLLDVWDAHNPEDRRVAARLAGK